MLPSGLPLNEEHGGLAAIWSWEGRCRQEKASRTDCQVLPQGDNRNNLTSIHWIWPPGETRAWESCAQEARVWPCAKCSRMRSERGWVHSGTQLKASVEGVAEGGLVGVGVGVCVCAHARAQSLSRDMGDGKFF